MRQKTGFKVVKAVGSMFISATIPFYATVVYTLGKTTRPQPKCGPLAVFSSKEVALEFLGRAVSDRTRWKIFEVKYHPSTKRLLWQWVFGMRLCGTPVPGTVLASSVKLIKEV